MHIAARLTAAGMHPAQRRSCRTPDGMSKDAANRFEVDEDALIHEIRRKEEEPVGQ